MTTKGNHTELIFIVDRSGSMGSMTEPTIAGYNSVLSENKDADGTANVTLCLFDNEFLYPYDHIDVKDVPLLDTTTYVPRGTTALLDAIGMTVSREKARQKSLPKEERPDKTIVTIITDGLENASREWTYEKVRKLLDKVQNKKKHPWIVTFLGANIDVKVESSRLGIRQGFAKGYVHDNYGYQTAYSGMAKMSKSLRSDAFSGGFTEDFVRSSAMSAMVDDAFSDMDAYYANREGNPEDGGDDSIR